MIQTHEQTKIARELRVGKQRKVKSKWKRKESGIKEGRNNIQLKRKGKNKKNR